MIVKGAVDDERQLAYYFHYLSSVKYSISELASLFGVCSKTVCNHFAEVKKSIAKGDILISDIEEKFKGFENVSEYRKSLGNEDVGEPDYTAIVRDIDKRLIEIDKNIQRLESQQPIQSLYSDDTTVSLAVLKTKVNQILALLTQEDDDYDTGYSHQPQTENDNADYNFSALMFSEPEKN